MRPLILAALLAFLIGCSARTPVDPTPPPIVSDAAPFTLTLSTTVGMGQDAGRAIVMARVQNSRGVNLPDIMVQFATDVGTLSADQMHTTADGIATITLIAPSTARVTVHAGTLTAQTLVTSQPGSTVQPPLEPQPPAPPVEHPPPSTPPVGQTPAGPLSLSLMIANQPTALHAGTVFSVQVANGPAQSYAWDFGDGGPIFTSLSPTSVHTYATVGEYIVTVTVRDVFDRSAHTIGNVSVRPPSYGVVLEAIPSTVVVNRSAWLTVFVTPMYGAPQPTTYAWDCEGLGVDIVIKSTNTMECTYRHIGTTISKVTVSSGLVSASAEKAIIVLPPGGIDTAHR
ncbi:MAG: hypothetical protein DMF91_11670 [Acidobacteria bacterium]|nr:MAG: hypothetical protein DMF91_11670 [Acidobacteriota bacterium]